MWSVRRGRTWVAGLCFLGAACGGPSLTVTTDPGDAVLLVDGRVTPEPEIPFRYYGDMELQAVPAPLDPDDWERAGTSRIVTVSEPVTPWVFPFDFLVEVIQVPFGGSAHQEVTLTLPDNPGRVGTGLEPAGAGDVLSRSQRARTGR